MNAFEHFHFAPPFPRVGAHDAWTVFSQDEKWGSGVSPVREGSLITMKMKDCLLMQRRVTGLVEHLRDELFAIHFIERHSISEL